MNDSLAGELGPGVLADLLEYLRQTGASGSLQLVNDRGEGEIELQAGAVSSSSWGRRSGAGALRELLRWDAGRFHYRPAPPPGPALVPQELLEALSLCARRLLGPIGEIFLEDAAEDLGYDDEAAVLAEDAPRLVETMAGYMEPGQGRRFLQDARGLLQRHGL